MIKVTEKKVSLLRKLISDPESFSNTGLANDLLGEFCKDGQLDSLIDLLRSDNLLILKSASFISSELTTVPPEVADQAILALWCRDHFVVTDLLSTIFRAAKGQRSWTLKYVLEHLSDLDTRIQWGAYNLMVRSSLDQFRAVRDNIASYPNEKISLGALDVLIANMEASQAIDQLAASSDRHLRVFATGIAIMTARTANKQIMGLDEQQRFRSIVGLP